MALITLGTNATTTLNALVWNPAVNAADLAQIVENIKSQPSLGTYQIINCSIASVGEMSFGGTSAEMMVTIRGYYVINNSLFSGA